MRQRDKQAPQSAEETVRDIRRATRRHFSAEEKIRIVLDGLRGEDSIAEHALGTLAVVGLALRQLERDRQPECIDEGVDLGRKPAAGTAHATAAARFFSPLAAC